MKGLDYISTLIRMSCLRTNLIWLQLVCREWEDRCDSERPVNSSIIWCLSCLIKHIIDHPRTNDSHPITHESIGFGITTTWPHCGLTGLRYTGSECIHRSPLWQSSRLRSPSHVSGCVSELCQKQLEGKMQLLQDYHTASVWLFWLNSWIYMNPSCISIWKPPTSMFGWWHFLCFLKVCSYRKIKVLPWKTQR